MSRILIQVLSAALIINDLDSLLYRIEALQAHPKYTDAVTAVQSAKAAMIEGRSAIHHALLRVRFGMDAPQ